MTKIKLARTDNYFRLSVEGHAGYAESGKDIVCSAVSILTQALMAELSELSNRNEIYGYSLDIHDEPPYICLSANTINSRNLYPVDMVAKGIKMLCEAYPDYVSLDYQK